MSAALTAGDIVNRIKAVMAVQGVAWTDATTRDRFKFGGPDTVVTGIATSFMGTFEAITRASEQGLNLSEGFYKVLRSQPGRFCSEQTLCRRAANKRSGAQSRHTGASGPA